MSVRRTGGLTVVLALVVTLLGGAAAYLHTNLEQLTRLTSVNVVRVGINSVPHQMTLGGWNVHAVSAQLVEAVRHLESQVETTLGHDVVVSSSDRGVMPEAVIPGTSIGTDALLRVVRRLTGHRDILVEGEIAIPFHTDGTPANDRVQLFLRVTKDGTVRSLDAITESQANLTALFRAAANAVLPEVNPYVWAKHLSDKGMPEKAAAILRRAAATARGRELAEIYNLDALVLFQLKVPTEDVIARFNRAIEADRTFVLPYLNLSELLIQVKRPEEATEMARRAVEADPNSARARLAYGLVLSATRKRSQAISQLKRATLPWPGIEDRFAFTAGLFEGTTCSPFDADTSAAALVEWGRLLEQLNDADGAGQLYMKAIECTPGRGVGYRAAGDLLRSQGKYADAIIRYRDSFERDSGDVAALSGWGFALNALMRPAEAIERFNVALNESPDHVPALIGMGDALRLMCRAPDALKKYRKAVALQPEWAWAHAALASGLEADDSAAAVTHYRRAIELDPRYVWALNKAGALFIRMGRPEFAVGVFERVVALRPGDHEAREQLKRAHAGTAAKAPTSETQSCAVSA